MPEQKDFWVEYTLSLIANTLKEIHLPQGTNTVMVRNPDGSNVIRLGLDQDTSTTNYEATAQFDGWGTIVRPKNIDRVFLISTASINKVKVFAIRTENPLYLVQNMAQAPTGDVSISSTVGLKASELKLDASKRLGVMLEGSSIDLLETSDLEFDGSGYLKVAALDTVALRANDLNIEAVTKDLQIDVKDCTLNDAELKPATIPTIFNVVMTNADTEYSQVLPAGCRGFEISLQENDTAFRLSFEAGKVATPTAPYLAIPATGSYDRDGVKLAATTLYFACGTAGKTIQLICWV